MSCHCVHPCAQLRGLSGSDNRVNLEEKETSVHISPGRKTCQKVRATRSSLSNQEAKWKVYGNSNKKFREQSSETPQKIMYLLLPYSLM